MPLWIPIVVTIVGLLWLIILGRVVPGLADEFLVTIIVFFTWLVYALLSYVDALVYRLSQGDPQAWVTIGIIIVIIVLIVKWKKSK